MLILSLESSAKPASVAICSNRELLGQYYQNSGLTHSRTLLVMAESLLKNLDISAADIDLIAVSCGPGSFTGVRIGVSAAKGLAWGLEKPVCGVSTLEAMAYQTAAPERAGTVPDILLCPVMDARRGQVYNALFTWKDNKPLRLCGDRAISLAELTAGLRDYSTPCVLLGDGAAITYEHLAAAGLDCSQAPDLMRWQTAYGVALAALETEPVSAIDLEPCYLRPSQAERLLNA